MVHDHWFVNSLHLILFFIFPELPFSCFYWVESRIMCFAFLFSCPPPRLASALLDSPEGSRAAPALLCLWAEAFYSAWNSISWVCSLRPASVFQLWGSLERPSRVRLVFLWSAFQLFSALPIPVFLPFKSDFPFLVSVSSCVSSLSRLTEQPVICLSPSRLLYLGMFSEILSSRPTTDPHMEDECCYVDTRLWREIIHLCIWKNAHYWRRPVKLRPIQQQRSSGAAALKLFQTSDTSIKISGPIYNLIWKRTQKQRWSFKATSRFACSNFTVNWSKSRS